MISPPFKSCPACGKEEFGVHLILAIEQKPGKEVKFDDKGIKAFVQEVYSERLRDAVLNAYKSKSKIELVERPLKK